MEQISVSNGAYFPKKKRLCSRFQIGSCFKKGKSVKICSGGSTLKLIYLLHTEVSFSPVQVLVSVPKSHMKKAVCRNRLKRLLRESYRRRQSALEESLREQAKQINLIFMFYGAADISFASMDDMVSKALSRLIAGLGGNAKVQ